MIYNLADLEYRLVNQLLRCSKVLVQPCALSTLASVLMYVYETGAHQSELRSCYL